MVSLFQYSDIRLFLKAWIQSQPKSGHGQLRKMAQYLKVHPTFMSHILKGLKKLSPENGARLCAYFNFTEFESTYFLLLIQYENAGTIELKKIFEKQLLDLQNKAQHLSARVSETKKMSEIENALFYSEWCFSAIRLITSLPGLHSAESIAETLNLDLKKVRHILEFLVHNGLCVLKDQYYHLGPSSTFLPDSSPFIWQHHKNWRIKAFEKYSNYDLKNEFSYTAPLTISKKDSLKFREELLELIKKFTEMVIESPAEELRCLNIDWFLVASSKKST